MIIRLVIVPQPGLGAETVWRDESLHIFIEYQLDVTFQHLGAHNQTIAVAFVECLGNLQFEPVGDRAVMDLANEDHLARCKQIDQLRKGDFTARSIEKCIGTQLFCLRFDFRYFLRLLCGVRLGGMNRTWLFRPVAILVRGPGNRSGRCQEHHAQ